MIAQDGACPGGHSTASGSLAEHVAAVPVWIPPAAKSGLHHADQASPQTAACMTARSLSTHDPL